MRTLDVWDAHLARCGAELLAARLALTEALRPRVQTAYDAVAVGGAGKRGETTLEYRSSLGEALPLPTACRAGTGSCCPPRCWPSWPGPPQEVERGISLVGPHRDELQLGLSGLPVKGYASHGESWSYALALRLASYELLRADGGEPVLVLDDVFAELDEGGGTGGRPGGWCRAGAGDRRRAGGRAGGAGRQPVRRARGRGLPCP
jgi:DNA replication and repair protein RecF